MWTKLDWQHAGTYPPAGERVAVITQTGDERELVYKDNLWWLPDMSMYVYFTPVYWKRLGT
jgi:hypothetical protein